MNSGAAHQQQHHSADRRGVGRGVGRHRLLLLFTWARRRRVWVSIHSRRKKRTGRSLAQLEGPRALTALAVDWQCAGSWTVVLALAPKQNHSFLKQPGDASGGGRAQRAK